MRAAFCLPLLLFILASFLIVPSIGASSSTSCANTCNAGTTGGSSCSSTASIPSPTTCTLSETITTSYQQNSNYQFLTDTVQASPATLSPAVSVNNYNIGNSGWFLTCPEPLGPSLGDYAPTDNSLFYPFTADNQFQFIAGDGCLATTTPLQSNVNLPVSIGWTVGPDGTFASAGVGSLAVSSLSNLKVSNLAYSPELGGGTSGTIASSFAVNSYVFQNVPAIAQNDIWTWSAPFAELSGVVSDSQTVGATPTIAFNEQETDTQGQLSGARNDSGSVKNATLSNASTHKTTGLALSGATSSSTASFATTTVNCFQDYCQSQITSCPASCPVEEFDFHGSTCSEFYCGTSISTTVSSTTTVSSSSCPSGSQCIRADICTGPGEGGTCGANCGGVNCCCTFGGASSLSSTSTSTTVSSTTTILVETYTCKYTYSYSETTNLQSVKNQQVPFNEVVINPPNPDGGLNAQYKQFNTPVVPYFTFNYIVPALDGQQLTNSYDIFSPWNYHTPINSIEMLPIDTVSNFFVNYSGSLISTPSGSLNLPGLLGNILGGVIGQLGNLLGNGNGNGNGNKNAVQQVLGKFGLYSPSIATPISIAEISSDYIFVLNYSKQDGTYYLSVLRLMPRGYYNTSSYTPSSVPSVSASCNPGSGGCSQASLENQNSPIWTNNWKGYWSNVIDAQNYTTYLIRRINLAPFFSTYVSGASSSPSCTNGNGCAFISQFTPLNITADSAGDVYITGAATSNQRRGRGSSQSSYPALIEIPAVNGPSVPSSGQISATTGDWSSTSGAPVLSEVAVSSDGTWLYAASPSSGTIYQFYANKATLSENEAINLAFSTISTGGTLQSGQLGAAQASLSITQYLYNGGLYGVKFNGQGAPDVTNSQNNQNINTDFDSQTFHHPLGLANVNGYVYVLDDWQGIAGENVNCLINGWFFGLLTAGCSNAGGTNFEILMVRVLDSSGGNVPINPTQFNDLYTLQGCQTTFTPSASSTGTQYTTSTCITDKTQPVISCTPGQPLCYTASTGCTDSNGNHGIEQFCVGQAGGNGYYGLSTTYFGAQGQSYPPYGWILSANITVSSGGSPVSFCSAYSNSGNNNDCTYNPSHMPSAYAGSFKPIGPALSATIGGINSGGCNDGSNDCATAFSVSLNGTMSLLFKQRSLSCAWFLWGTCIGSKFCIPYIGCVGSTQYEPHYNELATTQFSVENYTKYFDGNIGFSCYTDSQSNGNTPGGQNNGACGYLIGSGGTDYIKNMHAPVFSATNPFRYLESLGSTQLLTVTGAGSTSVSEGQGCSGVGSQGCTSYIVTYPGPPQATMSQSPIGWGAQDQMLIQATGSGESSTDNMQLTIAGSPSSNTNTITGQGSISYTICSTLEQCLAPGTYTVSWNDLTSKDSPASVSLTINPSPLLTIQNPQVITVQNGQSFESTETIVATAPYSGDIVTISISGQQNPVASGTGTATYSESNLPVGTYTVTATDTSHSQYTTTQTLQVVQSGGTSPTLGTAESLTSSINGYVLVPYEYTYEIKQSYSNPSPGVQISGGDGDETCPPLSLPSSSDSLVNVFGDSLTTGHSNQIAASIEGGATYLNDVANNGYYIANLTDAHLVLPPQIAYNIQNDKLFGTIWANATYCTGSPTTSLDCSANRQSVLNATLQLQYSVTSQTVYPGICSSQGCTQYGSYETFGTSPTSGSQYGASLVTGSGNAASQYVVQGSGSGVSQNGQVQLTIAQSPVVIKTPDSVTASTAGGDTIEILVGGGVVSTGIGSASYVINPQSCASQSPSTCLFAGTYQIEALDTNTGQSALTTLAILPQQIGFYYSSNPFETSVPLFDIYKQVVYDSPLDLYLNGSQYCAGGNCNSPYSLRGYQQLVYVMNDRFNNLIYVPVEADIANPISISLNVQSQPDAANSNLTTVTINGIAGTYTSLGSIFTPLPQSVGGVQQQVYLYYDDNLNYANYNPLDPTQKLDAEYCTFQTSQASGLTCTQSNPVYTGTGPSDPNRQQNAGIVTYAPSYNSMGTCNPPTNGLLEPQYFVCNINNNNEGAALSNSCPNTGALNHCSILYPDVAQCLSTGWANSKGALSDPQTYCSQTLSDYQAYLNCASSYTQGSQQFCAVTNQQTGNGICTSQIGLIGTAPIIDNKGDFSATISACGSRNDQIQAVYYGWPPPEPISVTQIPLAFTANAVNGQGCTGTCAASQQSEFNYEYAPTQTSAAVQIGLFQLSYGSLGLLTTLGAMALALVLMFGRGLMSRTSRRK